MSSRRIADCFAESLAPEFYAALLRHIVKANRGANRICGQFEIPERSDVFGHVERALVQKNLKSLPQEIQGIVVTNRKNSAKTSNYVEVRAGRLIMTASAVESPGQMPRMAQFRNSLTIEGQATLRFYGEPPETGDLPPGIHAIATHCTDRKGALADVCIVVPNSTGKRSLFSKKLTEGLPSAIEEVNEQEKLAPVEEIPELTMELWAASVSKNSAK